jgi:hypothetical protein
MDTMLMARGDVPITDDVHAVLMVGGQRWAAGSLDARDGTVLIAFLPYTSATAVVRVSAGSSLPLGSIARGLAFAPLSTASFDPVVVAETVVGGIWLGTASAQARVPVYRGWDDIKQRPFVGGDLRLARRIPNAVLSAGVSAAAGLGTFEEVAAVAGSSVQLSRVTGLDFGLRVPLVVTDEGGQRPYAAALTIGVSTVLGNPSHTH